jgi:hypothetical protein
MEIVPAFLLQANDELHDVSHSEYLTVTNDKIILKGKEFSNGLLHRKLGNTREF